MRLHDGMNDRFNYVPMAFLIIALTALLSDLRRWMAYSLMGLLIIISLYFQQKTISYWHQSTKVLQSLKKDFRWHDAPYVFVLNSPDNYHGIFMTSIIEERSGIDE